MFFDLRTLGNGKQLVTPSLSQVEKGSRCGTKSRQMRGEVKFLNHLSQLSGHSSHTFYTAGASRRVSQWDASTGVMQRES